MKTTVCLLVKNERECLEIMLPKIPTPSAASGFDSLIAIDGGSTDGSQALLEQHGIEVLAQSKRGRGEAFLTAFAELDSDAMIFFSPDGNEDIADLPRFKPLLEDGADIVIASRMMKESHNEEDDQWIKPRKWANNSFNALANWLFRRHGPYITDSINGYRAITRSAAERLQLTAHDYTIEYQMTIRGLKAQLDIREFPTHEGERLAGETGAPSLPTGIRFIGRLLTEWRHRPD